MKSLPEAKGISVRNVKSNDRRRRLRMIKVAEERSLSRFRSAASVLAIASETESARLDVAAMKRTLLAECRVNLTARLRVEIPGATPMDVRMDRPFLVIGSDPACDLHLDHEEIKPRHFLLQWIDGRLFCCDIRPRASLFPSQDSFSNGQWFDGNPIPIGPYSLNLVDNQFDGLPNFSPLDRSTQLANEYPLLALQFDGVEQSNNVWPINRMLTLIGRSSQCRLRLNHKSIAQIQACLLRTPNGLWLIDLTNDGTTGVNGRSIQLVPVDIGDLLQFGNFRVEVVTVAVPSTVSFVDKLRTKPLPPIKLDRPPKLLPRQMEDLSTRSQTDHDLSQQAGTIGRHVPIAQSPPVNFDRPLQGQSGQVPSHLTAPLNESGIERKKERRVVTVSELSDHRLPPISFDRRPTTPSHQPVSDLIAPVYATDSKELKRAKEPTTNDEGVAWNDQLPPVKFNRPTKDQTRQAAFDPADVTITDQKSVEPKSAAMVDPLAKTTALNVTDEIIAQYIQQQRSELATLKKRLEALKKIYDTASGQLISKKMRDTLEIPVMETMKCHDSIEEALNQFIQSVEQKIV